MFSTLFRRQRLIRRVTLISRFFLYREIRENFM